MASRSLNRWTQAEIDQLAALCAEDMTTRQIAQKIGRSIRAVESMRIRQGHADKRSSMEPAPAGFAEWAQGKTLREIRAHYRVGEAKAKAWRAEYNMEHIPVGVRKIIPIPADFRTVARGMHIEAAIKHYGRHYRTIRRWFQEAGLEPAQAPVVRMPQRPRLLLPAMPIKRAANDDSATGIACQLLRKFYPNVHRADIQMQEGSKTTWGDLRGLPDHGRNQFFVSGMGILNREELLELAEKHRERRAA